ncbi:MAG: hypothetical protein SGCHY_005359 [Lobulomycetales sp.]
MAGEESASDFGQGDDDEEADPVTSLNETRGTRLMSFLVDELLDDATILLTPFEYRDDHHHHCENHHDHLHDHHHCKDVEVLKDLPDQLLFTTSKHVCIYNIASGNSITRKDVMKPNTDFIMYQLPVSRINMHAMVPRLGLIFLASQGGSVAVISHHGDADASQSIESRDISHHGDAGPSCSESRSSDGPGRIPEDTGSVVMYLPPGPRGIGLSGITAQQVDGRACCVVLLWADGSTEMFRVQRECGNDSVCAARQGGGSVGWSARVDYTNFYNVVSPR